MISSVMRKRAKYLNVTEFYKIVYAIWEPSFWPFHEGILVESWPHLTETNMKDLSVFLYSC